ncbi:MAG: DUF4835 domain-containing protein [Bacteroidetes bacterium]|nr:MAG: DUF4835 domain-containing protein [Bacteroidota bacterium]
MRKTLILLIIILSQINTSYSQELNCRVQVVSKQVQGTDKRIFNTLQKVIYEFLNNYKWTNNVYSDNERIECTFYINIKDHPISSDIFKGTMQVQASRPIFNTSYNSVLFNYIDNDVEFRYTETQELQFNETSYTSNLTSLLAYYAYIIIGLDYDSFSLEGGTPFYEKAEKIVNNAQNSPYKGWKAFEDRKNRYWIVENILNDTYSPIRECLYSYHRLGLDIMSEKVSDGRSVISESLETFRQVHQKKPGSFLMQLFFDAKRDEIVNIFSEAFPEEKTRIYNVLKTVDPANDSKYQKIIR